MLQKCSIDPQDTSIIYATSISSHMSLQKLSVSSSSITLSSQVGVGANAVSTTEC